MTNNKGSYAPVNGLEMYYEVHGDGPPLVMLHGGVTPSEMFGAPLAEMVKTHRVIAPHARVVASLGRGFESHRPHSYKDGHRHGGRFQRPKSLLLDPTAARNPTRALPDPSRQGLRLPHSCSEGSRAE